MFFPLMVYRRTPLGAIEDLPTSDEVTVRMPNVPVVASDTVPFCDTEVSSVYSGDGPIWYGHQTCGCEMVRLGNALGVNETVLVLCALTDTVCCTVIGVPPPGGVMVALTEPVCVAPELLVTSVFTVSAELLRSAALACTTWALLSLSGLLTLSWTGNCRPVLLSGGIWFQSTSSSVNIVSGLFGRTSMATVLVPRRSSRVMSKANRV